MASNPYRSKSKGGIISSASSKDKLLQRSNRFSSSNAKAAPDEIEQVDEEFGPPSCTEMCPLSECLEREKCLDVHPLEADDANGTIPYEAIAANVNRKIDPKKAVKKFRRPAAGLKPPKPSEVRTIDTILKTLEYLFSEQVLGRSDVPLSVRAAFIRDRGRALRSDLSRHQAIKENKDEKDRERAEVVVGFILAQFHSVIAHELCEEERSEFDPFQNAEQLSKILTTLGDSLSEMNRAEADAFHAMKMLMQIQTFPIASLGECSSPQAWAMSLCLAYRTGDAAGWIQRAIKGPSNCSLPLTVILCLFAFPHLLSMRMLLLEQMHASFSAPVSQTISINELLRPFGFADLDEANRFFLQFPSANVESGSIVFSKNFQFPETVSPSKSKLLVSNRLNSLSPGNYENALYLSIASLPSIQKTDDPTHSTSHDHSCLTSAINGSAAPAQEKIVDKTPHHSAAFNKLVDDLISETIKATLQPFVISAIRRRSAAIKAELEKSIYKDMFALVFAEFVLFFIRQHLLKKKTVSKWRYFVEIKDLKSKLGPLLPTNRAKRRLSLPLLLGRCPMDFYQLLFGSSQFSEKFLRVILLDWCEFPSLPHYAFRSDKLCVQSIYKCKGLDRILAGLPKVDGNPVTLVIVFVDSLENYTAICAQLKQARFRSLEKQVNLLFVAFVIGDASLLNKTTCKDIAIGLPSFHMALFSPAEFKEDLLVEWLRSSLALLLLPGGCAWLESDLIFQEREILSHNMLEVVIDADFAAFLSENKPATIENWRSSKWYRRYIAIDAHKMRSWEQAQLKGSTEK